MYKTGLVSNSHCLEHDPGTGHPESPARLEAILTRIRQSGLLQQLEHVSAPAAQAADLLRAHSDRHVEAIRTACGAAPTSLDADTHVSSGSWEAAVRAAGATLLATEKVTQGAWSSAFCAIRPPGHHAERERPMGFCLFNSVAIAAMAALQGGLERVAILDWDVHHGNGTQDIFEADPRVFYASLHQAPLYPQTGAESERGTGPGAGTTLNTPLPAGSDDVDWCRALERRVLPALEDFSPQLLFISAGFDAHRDDPLAGTDLSTEGFRQMTRSSLDLARRVTRGRVVSVLEGGYNLDALADSVEAHLEELITGQAACD